MDAEKIVKLTPTSISELLDARKVNTIPKQAPGERQTERWAFAGAVEVWLPEGAYGDRHVMATLHNLSQNGLAMRTRRSIPVDTKISVAIHQPELSCYGHALVRHCTQAHVGYLVGVEFIFFNEEETTDNE